MPSSPTVPGPAHLKLLQIVYDSFRNTAEWPKTRWVRLEIRRDGDLFELSQDIGPELIVVGSSHSPRATCELRIRALLVVKQAERDIENVGAVIPYLVGRYLEGGEEEEPRITPAEVQQALNLSDLETRRALSWLAYAPRLLRSFGSASDGRITDFSLSDDILRLEGVTSLHEYLERTDRLDEDWKRKVAEVTSPPAARSLDTPTTWPRQRVATSGLDLLELHPNLRHHVEKLFADEHYGDAVRKAPVVFEVRVRDMVASRLPPGEEAPYGVDLMGRAFTANDPLVRLNAGVTHTHRDEQRGFQFLAQGAMAWLRNCLTHELTNLQACEALERLAFVSMLMKRLDAAEPGTGRPS